MDPKRFSDQKRIAFLLPFRIQCYSWRPSFTKVRRLSLSELSSKMTKMILCKLRHATCSFGYFVEARVLVCVVYVQFMFTWIVLVQISWLQGNAIPKSFASMEVLLLNYVALCYLLVFYFRCKRWYCTLGTGGGRRTLKRLRQSAPQILVRTEQQRRRCSSYLEMSLHCSRYGFCYYYGGHANHPFTWVLAASSLYCSLGVV